MDETYNSSGIPLAMFRQDMPCGYFSDGRICSIEYLYPGRHEEFHAYLERGYRRQGSVYYRYACKRCRDCIPIRLDVRRFRPGKCQRRTLKKNRDVRIETTDKPWINREKISMFSDYLEWKHGIRAGSTNADLVDQLESIHFGFAGSLEMNYYVGERLIAVGIIDAGVNGLSSNYFYYDCACLARRPGIFGALKEIELAGRLGKQYYYLGYYMEKKPKMAYKGSFTPHQLLIEGEWIECPYEVKRGKNRPNTPSLLP